MAWCSCNVSVKSKVQHAPPGKPPGIWLFWKLLFKFPLPGWKCRSNAPHWGPFRWSNAPTPGTFHRHKKDRKTVETPSVVEQNLYKCNRNWETLLAYLLRTKVSCKATEKNTTIKYIHTFKAWKFQNLNTSNTAQSLFKPFPRNQLATKAQSFPRKSSNTASPMIARHAKDFTWNQGCSSNLPPLKHADQIPHPLEDSDNQIPSSPGRQRCQMPGVCPGRGGHVEASIWPIHYLVTK